MVIQLPTTTRFFSTYNLSGIVTGITNVSPGLLQLSVSPNPFQQQLNIKAGKQLRNVTLQLFDVNGRLIKKEERKMVSAGSTINWEITNLAEGAYYLRLQTKEYQTTVKLLHLK